MRPAGHIEPRKRFKGGPIRRAAAPDQHQSPAGSPTAPLSAIGLTHRYRRRPALRAVDLVIDHPGLIALVGPNGAGKSTLMKVWAGLERPAAGQARVYGVDPWRQRRRAIAQLGYVPQAPALYRSLTVMQHLDLASTERDGYDVALARRYLADLAVPLSAKGAELSGGQRAQVSLAIALGTRARVLLLDEPMASLDPLARREFLAVLTTAVSESGATALLSSHVVSDIEDACERLVVLGEGQVLLDGRISDLVAAHAVSATAARAPMGATHVARFMARGHTKQELWRLDGQGGVAPVDEFRPATLEEVVVGYLTLGRSGR
jgi:ABC-2 type transport system ATP-binding protein